MVDMLIKEAKVDVNFKVGGDGWTALNSGANGDHGGKWSWFVVYYSVNEPWPL